MKRFHYMNRRICVVLCLVFLTGYGISAFCEDENPDEATFKATFCLNPGSDISGCDFVSQSRPIPVEATPKLAGVNMSNSNFTGLDLRNADFTGADLTGACFTKANLTNANFTDAKLSGAIFTRATLTGATIDTSYAVENANFDDAALENSTIRVPNGFVGTSFVNTDFRNSQITDTSFESSDLTTADFDNVTFNSSGNLRFTRTNCYDTDFNGAVFNLSGGDTLSIVFAKSVFFDVRWTDGTKNHRTHPF